MSSHCIKNGNGWRVLGENSPSLPWEYHIGKGLTLFLFKIGVNLRNARPTGDPKRLGWLRSQKDKDRTNSGP